MVTSADIFAVLLRHFYSSIGNLIIYRVCRHSSQVVKLKMPSLQHLWFTVMVKCNVFMRHDKNVFATRFVNLLGVSTCRLTKSECLRHIHFNLRQDTTYPNVMSKSCSLSYFEHSSNWHFSIHSLWTYTYYNGDGRKYKNTEILQNSL